MARREPFEDLATAAPSVVKLVAAEPAGIAQLQARHRREKATTAVTVLVVAPLEDGRVVVVGPTVDRVARVALATFRRLLSEADGLSALEAARHLGRELSMVDDVEGGGLTVAGLGTRHVYADRLRGSKRWQRLAQAATQAEGAEDWRGILTRLEYVVEQLPREGYLARFDGSPVVVVIPRSSVADFSRLDGEGRLPTGVLLSLCRSHGAPFGMLAAGSRFRLYAMGEHAAAAASRYVEIDTALLGADDRPFLGLLGPDWLASGGIAEIVAEADAYGQVLRERLDAVLRQAVLPQVGLALGRWALAAGDDLADQAVLEGLEAAALTFVFRVIFLLHAEASGYLPMEHAAYRARSMMMICDRAYRERDGHDHQSTSLWGDYQNLVERVRTGHAPWNLPAYNGDLFAADGIRGADVLEHATIPDAALGGSLAALGRDPDQPDVGIDYSGLGVEHLGYVYEGLLSLRLSQATEPLRYDAATDAYVPATGGAVDVSAGELVWATNEGGRKRQGVYYTPTVIVQHLVRTGVRPAFARHLDAVRTLAESDPAAAAARLFEFFVLDPACGSAHFLVEVVNELADQIAQFIGEVPLPGVREQLDGLRASAGTYGALVDDTALVRRLALKRCVYGVDLSAMGAEIAKVSLWLSTFVPGLALSYLDHNIRQGNSLVGVAALDELKISQIQADAITIRVRDAGEAAARLAVIDDATPNSYRESRDQADAITQTLAGAGTVCSLVTAGYLGRDGVTPKSVQHEIDQRGVAFLDGQRSALAAAATANARAESALDWPLAFPEVFARDQPGFDAVIGNPPWDEVTVEELAFYTRYRPGLRSLPESEQRAEIARMVTQRPELEHLLAAEQAMVAEQRGYYNRNPAYPSTSGDPDVAKLFARRYATLLRSGGTLAVVLPRTLTSSKGGSDFRQWLFTECFPQRIDFLLNTKRWAFDIEPRYTIALITAGKGGARTAGEWFETAGVAASRTEFDHQVAEPGVPTGVGALGLRREVPLVNSQAQADLLAALPKRGSILLGDGHWRCFPVGELHETNDRTLWRDATDGVPLWKGESFDQYDPHGADVRPCPLTPTVLKKVLKSQPGQGTLITGVTTKAERVAAVARSWGRARLAFRDVSRATDSRTVRAALVPPGVLLTNTAPYLAFVDDDPLAEAACLSVLNSLVFDWQARRYVELHMNFFIAEGLLSPTLTDDLVAQIGRRAARLSCRDDRFAEFATATSVEYGRMPAKDREQLRAEIDALVAHAYAITPDGLEVVFADFTLNAVSDEYREAVREAYRALK